MKPLIVLSTTIFCLLLSGCDKNEPCNEAASLSETIIGRWELFEKQGFPYSDSAFEPVRNEFLELLFEPNGVISFIDVTGETEGAFEVFDEEHAIEISTTVNFRWEISFHTHCEFIVDMHTDEGLSRLKFRKI